MRAETCVLCGGGSWSPLLEVKGHKILKCEGCGLARTEYPKPVEEMPSPDLYSQEYFDRVMPSSSDTARRVRSQWERVRFVRKHCSSGRLVDLGCGEGIFVAAAKQAGFDATGVDVSKWAVDFAKKELGVDLTVASMEDVQFPAASFDIVTMWHALEHTVDPVSTLQRVHSWLRPGGIVVIEVPDYESYDARMQGGDWEDWSIPYHRWHFTPKVLERLLARCDFRGLTPVQMPSPYVRKRLRGVPVLGWFRKIIWRFFRGNFVRVVGRKK